MSPRPDTRTALVPVWRLRRWWPAALAAAAGIGGPVTWVLAQQPVPLVAGEPIAFQDAKKDGGKKAEAPPEKTVTVNFESAGWDTVLDWYAKETGLTFVSAAKPTGSVVIRGEGRKYTRSGR